MIVGAVNARGEAVVRQQVRGPGGMVMSLDAVIDTGFTASLILPIVIVEMLGLPRESTSRAVLADGSVRQFDLFAAEVEWFGNWKSVLVSAVGEEVLIGMRLLVGYELRVAVVNCGAVTINPLP